MIKALITGGTGYIGSRLVKELIKRNWNVALITRESSNFDYLDNLKDQYTRYICNEDITNLELIIKEFQPEVVFHLASYVTNSDNASLIDKLINSNLLFGTKLLQAMKNKPVKYFINTGTYWQNFNDDDYNPVNLYAATKEAFIKLIKYFTETSNLKVVTLKLFDVYGPCDKRNKLITSLDKYVNSETELNLSKGEQIIDYIYIDDVIDAYIKAYEYMKHSDFTYKEFGVGSEDRHLLKEVITMVEDVLGKRLNINLGGKPYREREVMIPWDTYDKLPNWTPTTKLREGLYNCYYKEE